MPPSPTTRLSRWILGLFRSLGSLLPDRARRDVWSLAETDLSDRLGAAEERGVGSVVWVGLAALFDAWLRIPGERRRYRTRERVGWGERMTTMGRQLRQAVRGLSKRPGFSGLSALTLALGIGANLAIFAVVHAVLIRPLPFPDSDRVVSIRHHAPGLNLNELQSSDGTVNFYTEHAEVFDSKAVLSPSSANLTGVDQADRVSLLDTSPEVFDVLRMTPLMGRRLLPADAETEAPVMMLTASAWRGRFGSDPDVLGRTVRLDGRTFEVIGVLPPEFETIRNDLFGIRPYRVDPEGAFGQFGIDMIARIDEGFSFEAAEQRIQDIQVRLPEFFTQLDQEFLERAGWAVTFVRQRDRMVGNVRTSLWLVMGTVGVVLLIACANVANLFLVRAEDRRKEVAVHTALGAGRSQLAQMVLTESLVLGLLGGALGILLASGAVSALRALDPGSIPRLGEVTVGLTVIGAAVGLSVLAGLFFGAIAFARIASTSTTGMLRDGGQHATAGRAKQGLRNVLVTVQMSLALVLLIGAGLMLRSMVRMAAVDPGFEPEQVTSVLVSFGDTGEWADQLAFYEQLYANVAAMPGVQSVGGTNSLPFTQTGFAGNVLVESFPREEGDLPDVAGRAALIGDYHRAMGIELLEGREPTAFESSEGIPPVWINTSFAERFLPGVSPIGERIALDDTGDEENRVWLEIAGVYENVKRWNLTDPVDPLVWLPAATYREAIGASLPRLFLQVRADLDPGAIGSMARGLAAEIEDDVPLTSVRSMEALVAESMATTTFTLWLLGLASAIALVLGAVGLFGVISYVVSQRTREIGVRVALGAETGAVQRMIVRQGLVTTTLGIVIGLLGAFGLSGLMEAVLFEVSGRDVLTFTVAPTLLLVTSFLASWLPARRASRVDPVVALRAD